MRVIAWLSCAGAMWAQTPLAQFSGRIIHSDGQADGGPVPNAVVGLCNEESSLGFMTSADT